jgi:hypothetical protein
MRAARCIQQSNCVAASVSCSPISELPRNVAIRYVFRFLRPIELLPMACVCRLFRAYTSDCSLVQQAKELCKTQLSGLSDHLISVRSILRRRANVEAELLAELLVVDEGRRKQQLQQQPRQQAGCGRRLQGGNRQRGSVRGARPVSGSPWPGTAQIAEAAAVGVAGIAVAGSARSLSGASGRGPGRSGKAAGRGCGCQSAGSSRTNGRGDIEHSEMGGNDSNAAKLTTVARRAGSFTAPGQSSLFDGPFTLRPSAFCALTQFPKGASGARATKEPGDFSCSTASVQDLTALVLRAAHCLMYPAAPEYASHVLEGAGGRAGTTRLSGVMSAARRAAYARDRHLGGGKGSGCGNGERSSGGSRSGGGDDAAAAAVITAPPLTANAARHFAAGVVHMTAGHTPLPPASRAALRGVTSHPDFTEAECRKASEAAALLCRWVMVMQEYDRSWRVFEGRQVRMRRCDISTGKYLTALTFRPPPLSGEPSRASKLARGAGTRRACGGSAGPAGYEAYHARAAR